MKLSKITIRENQETKEVQIAPAKVQALQTNLLNKWQAIIDTAARLANVPSSLIMCLNETNLEVLLASKNKENPYKAGEKEDLIYGLYCETVIGKQDKLLVPDATQNPIWSKNNPDIDINMISYLGFPINWPNGDVFGTVCFLDKKENHYSSDYENLLEQIKQHIEDDLKILILNTELEIKNQQLEHTNRTKTKLLSLISHDVRGALGTLNQYLLAVLSNFNNTSTSQLKPILRTLSASAGASYQTLENILSWAKNDQKLLEAKPKKVNITTLADEAITQFESATEIKKISVHKHYSSQDLHAWADEGMLLVILQNILSNAIKYTHTNGKIHIRIAPKNNLIHLEIEDTGIGISESDIETLFDYNDQHSQKGTAGENSAGVGLMLVKDFMHKNHITYHVSSQLGKGTIFALQLNMKK